jgi:hypothetical protein
MIYSHRSHPDLLSAAGTAAAAFITAQTKIKTQR